MLELRKITKDYVTSSETVNALRGVDITFRDREFVSILGPSGCGKTTLLNIVGGLDRYTSGDLVISGKSTKLYKDRDWDIYRNHRVGFIFQSYNLIPHQTVLGNVELALTIAGISREERVERAKRALDKVGLSGQYYKRPNQLSGGQCQRVAIARALVNDPEILLADEPTGALDTVTSVQIMDLIREIAGERLVIMVTHNPELAEEYSTRIIRLLDGNIIEDTDPVSEKEREELVKLEGERAEAERAEAERIAAEKKPGKKVKGQKSEKAKMSLFTAFRLSARNLISKKGRTSMVGFAGSIGIIGIALVLAFSSGIKGYIASMQDDMLSGNPITITETTYDFNALTGMMDNSDKKDIIKEPNHAYINSLIEYVAKMQNVSDSMIIKNDINKLYADYVKAMPKEYYNAMTLGYGIDTTHSIYTSFEGGFGENKASLRPSIAALTERYTAILSGTKFSQYSSYITTIVPSFAQAPNDTEYIRSQYEVYGEIADEYDEVMLVLNSNQELSDLLLARLGYYTEEEFYNLVYKVTKDDKGNSDPRYDPDLDVTEFSYEELMNKTFTWYSNDQIFTKQIMTNPATGEQITDPESGEPMISAITPFKYASDASGVEGDGVTLRIVGVLIADENTTYGCLSSGIYYTEAFTEYVLDENIGSEIVEYVSSTENKSVTSVSFNGMNTGIFYEYEYLPFDAATSQDIVKGTAFVGKSFGIEDMMGAMSGSGSGSESGSGSTGGSAGGGMGAGGAGAIDMTSMKTVDLRWLGGVDVPNSISIYPISFDEKIHVTDYLEAWNHDKNDIVYINADGEEITVKASERTDIKHTDVLELVINMINTMIDIVSYALIAFTSVSLVVSTVMIGIITYVSVVERIKEIGVIRSLGGRKKDVSRLFVAETAIIGCLAGLIGVGATYLISLAVNLILKPLIGYANIAALPIGNAIFLVLLSIGLTLISGLIPAKSAANKDPVVALRTE